VNIFIPAAARIGNISQLREASGAAEEAVLVSETELDRRSWDFCIYDRRATNGRELRRYRHLGVPVGLDEGGEYRQYFSYLIDTFPLPGDMGGANVFDSALLPQASRRREPPERFLRFLVSFGGEDPGHLTERMLEELLSRQGVEAGNITVVEGPLFGPRGYPAGVEILRAPDNLAEILHRYDVLFTSFGLTAYEGLSAGCAVLLLNPSSYHDTLSKKAGFPRLGVKKIHSSRLRRYMENPRVVNGIMERIAPGPPRDLAALLSRLVPPLIGACPICGTIDGEAVLRQEERSFFRCRRCGIVYQLDFIDRGESYREEYFFEEYRRRYGRSYLEDFEQIRGFSKKRLASLSSIVSPRSKKLLDVGCAYGPFLQEAREAGFRAEGLDPVESAVGYVRKELKIPASQGFFEDHQAPPNSYDVISMWYVIEHFADPARVLCKVRELLKPGGVFAFSTPNSSGISGRGRIGSFLKKSPADHHTVWSPGSARRILNRRGFRVRKVVVTGHHPERFPLLPATGRGGWYRVLLLLSRVFRLGDSFEIYATKRDNDHGKV